MGLMGSYFEFNSDDLYEDPTVKLKSTKRRSTRKETLAEILKQEINDNMNAYIQGNLREVLMHEKQDILELFEDYSES